MISRNELACYLDDYLDINGISDGIWNGLQVEGKDEINNIIVAVDAGIMSFEKTIELSGDLLLVHHGHFLKSLSPTMTGWNKKRLSLLLNNDISLYAAHLPLDAHPEVGNNAQLHKLIGSTPEEPFCYFGSKSISWVGSFEQPTTVDAVAEKLASALPTTCKTLPFGPKEVKRVALCSGGGGYKVFSQAVEAGVDLYITGDSVEIYHLAKDAGISVIFAGHYATETVGVKALAKQIESKFDVATQFVDIPTGL